MTTSAASTSVRTTRRSSSITTSSAAVTHTVSVGKADDMFEPISLEAAVGDLVVFEFYPANHSVVRAEYEYPCVPYEDVIPEAVGFFSGFVPVKTIEANVRVQTYMPIED